jgi:predicted amidohydrolase
MGHDLLNVAMVQASAVQHNVGANLAHLEELLAPLGTKADVIVLPEMFNTGYTTQTQWAEGPELHTHRWMRSVAARHQALVVGSVMWRDHGQVYNRMLGIMPDGSALPHYDKRHLFTLAGEHKEMAAGHQQVIWHYRGWRIRPLVCYDLRFPVWARNKALEMAELYLVVANWPAPRLAAWHALCAARSVENQAYLVAINRAADIEPNPALQPYVYAGGSVAHHPDGSTLKNLGTHDSVELLTLSHGALAEFKSRFTFWQDGDNFELHV